MAIHITGATTTDRVRHSGTNLNSIPVWSFAMWLKMPSTITSFREVWSKYYSTTYIAKNFYIGAVTGGLGKIGVQQRLTSASTLSYASDYILTPSVWNFVAATVDDDRSATDRIRIYWGTLTTPASLQSITYMDDFTGTVVDDSTYDVNIGDSYIGTQVAAEHDCAWFSLWNKWLSLGEIKSQQYDLSKPIARANNRLFVHYISPSITPTDWSGNGYNGTVYGTPTQVAHVPIPIYKPTEAAITVPTPVLSLPAGGLSVNDSDNKAYLHYAGTALYKDTYTTAWGTDVQESE